MPEEIPRPLIVLAAIVALVAVIVGVKDYVSGRKEANPSATTSAPATVQPNPANTKNVSKKPKTSSGEARRPRRSSPDANAAATAQAGTDDLNKPLISDRANNGAEGTVVADAANTAAAQAGNDEVDGALDRKHVASPASEAARSALFVAQCVPLPNVTDPRDADGPYYQNWAREYSCVSWR
jgi:cytoskeletal protein RodZ